uniref:golgin subfamily A member 3-like isoform X1 n=1 Tax=Oncorhynchus gorbuscha TaxID=8017 RepID=UPI001EAF084F|nr:golgin subfamily A member 3-like isoform X1 [Oncorhynchus gorbuscha]XP_046207031.1 golgin subfamily A member 3-like isoform X1 [Oncorhynchus gorbuscha]XP_046207032.1 golgin subfamily A member 3-like isoform X1 [Oncorhynchus gorbuscha]XP_046207033.1 golgin subfamily A member 3-like isoform X1 [Oncorhynchus gorbuscha]
MENHNSVIAEMETTNVEIHQLDLVPQSKDGGADSVVSDAQLLKKGGLDKPTASGDVLNGFKADVVPNGERVAEGPRPGAGGDGRLNGPLPPPSPPAAQGTSPPVSPQSKEPSQGVAAIPPPMLEKSEGASAVGPAHKGDALQSLRLSMPMQETELSDKEPSLEMENEEKIRRDARRRLEEQLKQYRVQRHKETSYRSTPKSRSGFSTLDPDLMMHPEVLPRASTTSMTTEYSFLRTSVPRGPKLGSLGIPPAKERKSRSPRPSKIHSLADYKTLEPVGGTNDGGGFRTSEDSSMGSLGSNLSSVSTLSEVSMMSEAGSVEITSLEALLGSSMSLQDNTSEMDAGSESGMGSRPGGDGDDSSTYSSVSTSTGGTGIYGMLAEAVGRQRGGNYMVEGREIIPEAMGNFPSLQEVLQAASDEQHLLEQDREGTGGPRSRRDSFSSSVSLESSVMGHDEMLQVLKEKMRLEGQLESLSSEANQALKEKTELQAKLATVNAQLQAQVEQSHASQEKQSSLNKEVSTLRQSCFQLERAMVELQGNLESKNAGLASLGNDLQVAEEQYQRLMGKVEEMQQNVTSRDNAVQELRQQMGGLQTQLQQVQLERTTLQSRLKTSQAEIISLQQVRQWYQQQLALAQEARVRLQGEMANMQAGQMTQIGALEHLKLENVTLSHQLTQTQHRSIKEKERIAVQLQSIEADMMTQEAAYQQIQDAKSMVEDDLQHKLDEFEEEREHLQKLANTASSLERELEQMKVTLSQKDLQLEALQKEHLELMRQLTATQESLHTKEQSINQLEARYLELEATLAELQTETNAKDENIQYLQNEKIVLEVALQVARADKSQLDEGAERLGEEVLVASDVLDQLRQEVQVKSSQIGSLQQDNGTLKKQAQKLKEQFMQQKVMVEAYRRDASSKEQLISELKSTKKRLVSEVKGLKQELLEAHGEKQKAELEQSRLQTEVVRVQQQMNSLENHLQSVQTERDQLESQIQSLQFDQSQLAAVTEENEGLKKQVDLMQSEARKAISEQKVRMKRLGTDLTSAQKDMKAKHKAYENAVGILSRRLQEALADKETTEAELVKLKAQVSDGGNNQALQDKIEALQSEYQAVSHSKAMLEKELQEVISLTSTELEELQEKVMELEDELQEARCFKRRIRRLEDANKKLSLELEHEKGRLTGLGQSHNALREHTNILETALAKREADLVQLNLQVQAVLKRKEEEDQQMKQLVQTLQVALEKEKAKVKDLKEQVAAAKAEAAHNRRHYRAAMLELCEIKKDLQAKEELVKALHSEAHKLQAQDEKHSQEVSRFQEELSEAHSQLQILQKQLDEQLSKQPLTNQEVEDLKWEVEQRQREIEAQRQQLELVEQCSQSELDSLQTALQSIKVELESVQDELSSTRKDKFMLQAKVGELRNSMKTVLLQNQQLKLDLKQNRLRKQRMEPSNPSNPVTPVKIPDCPVPASLLDELLKPSASVNKEPLNNLHNCLRQLKHEMDNLQKQMEEHTVTVHESMTSWTNAEEELTRLGVPLENDSITSPPLNQVDRNGGAEEAQPS